MTKLYRFDVEGEGNNIHVVLQEYRGPGHDDINIGRSKAERNLLNLLDQSVKNLEKDLPELSAEELEQLIAAEKAGKTRKTVVEAMERALETVRAGAEEAPELEEWVTVPFVQNAVLNQRRNYFNDQLRSDNPPSLEKVRSWKHRV